MSVTVHLNIPSTLRRFTDDLAQIELQASSAQEALQALSMQYPMLRSRLFTSTGEMFGFVAVFLNGKNIKHSAARAAALQAGDELALIPAIAGG